MSNPFVAVLMGSDSDLPRMQNTLDVLDTLGVSWEAKVTSAHRTPAATHDYVRSAEQRGCRVFRDRLGSPEVLILLDRKAERSAR